MPNPNYYLVLSSTSFLWPVIYGFYNGHRFLPFMSLLSTITSVSYWLDPHHQNYIKNMDLQINGITCISYIIYGTYNIPHIITKIAGYSDLFMILCCYNASCILYNKHSHAWIPFHIAFHYFCIIGQFIILMYYTGSASNTSLGILIIHFLGAFASAIAVVGSYSVLHVLSFNQSI